MPTVKLTDAATQRLKAPRGARVDFFDASLPGLALRVSGVTPSTPEGRRTWSLFYRYGGQQRRLTFGTYPAISLAQARRKAGDALALVGEGKDPAVAKADAKAAAARPADTVASVADLFIKRHLEGKQRAASYIADTTRNFRNHVLPRWSERNIATISRRDVIQLLDAIMDSGSGKLAGGPIAANRVLATIRAMFNFALRRGLIDANPALLVTPPGAERARDRVLSDEEVRAVWQASYTLSYPFGPWFRLLLITGQRRSEVSRMRCADLDLERAVWTLPAAATKAGRAHIVPLAPLAVDLLRSLPRMLGPYVFSTDGGEKPIRGFAKAKVRLDRGISEAAAPWTIHDLRRTAASGMASLGSGRFVIGKVLNHSDRSVTAIYDRHEYLGEKRRALETWAEHLHNLTRPPLALVAK
jgi:integrase